MHDIFKTYMIRDYKELDHWERVGGVEGVGKDLREGGKRDREDVMALWETKN